MNHPVSLALSVLALLAAAAVGAAETQQIVRAGTQKTSSGPCQPTSPAACGSIRSGPPTNINASGGLVTFEPGARSAWHTHPAGSAWWWSPAWA
jgi:quercetin dioxygenase-like cupin family protein